MIASVCLSVGKISHKVVEEFFMDFVDGYVLEHLTIDYVQKIGDDLNPDLDKDFSVTSQYGSSSAVVV